MNKILKTIYVALFVLWAATANQAANSATAILDDQFAAEISAQVAAKQNAKVSELWNDLRVKGYVARVGSDEELRYPFVMLHGIIEEAICTLLENKHLLKSKFIIIAPQPPNPLRRTGAEIQKEKALAKTKAEKLALETMEYRNDILVNQYLAKKLGILMAVYNKSAFSNEGSYRKLVGKYSENLIDMPVINTSTTSVTGANYKLIDKYNNDIFVSLQSYQFLYEDHSKKNKWAIWLGSPQKDNAIAARQQFIDDYLSSLGVLEFKS